MIQPGVSSMADSPKLTIGQFGEVVYAFRNMTPEDLETMIQNPDRVEKMLRVLRQPVALEGPRRFTPPPQALDRDARYVLTTTRRPLWFGTTRR
jgi:hypothetical protein